MFATLLALTATSFAAAAPPAFELKDGDRVVWIGNTLVEREQRYGYWETALLAAFADKNITFRNLGWSGDTVYGDARAGFDTPAKGFERLVKLTLELKPTVIFVSYGTNESFEGEAGLEKFEKGLNKLLDALKPSGARVVLFTPLPMESNSASKTTASYNQTISKCSELLKKIVQERDESNGYYFGNIGDMMEIAYPLARMERPPTYLTDNGLHFNETGFKRTVNPLLIVLGYAGKNPIHLQDWQRLEPVRQAVIAKNQLFFYKWRPQNETYLFGFRKHEQGKNAKEIVEFDPLIEAAEKQIRAELAKLKK